MAPKTPMIELTAKQRTAIRKLANAANQGAPPVLIVSGSVGPQLVGTRCGYSTPAGTPIPNPAKYRGPKVYRPSTRRVMVGLEWLEAWLWAEMRREPKKRGRPLGSKNEPKPAVPTAKPTKAPAKRPTRRPMAA